MQGISSYISCIKLIKCSYNQQDRVLRKLPFSILSSLHGTTLPHNNWFDFIVLLPLGMQLSRFVHLTAAAVISTLLLHTQILVTYPCSLLDKLSNAYPHASFWPQVWKPHHFKMMLFTKCILVWNVNLNYLEFSSFSVPKLLRNPMRIHYKTH